MSRRDPSSTPVHKLGIEPMKKSLVKNKEAVKSVIEILDSYTKLYKELSKNKEKTYLDYFANTHTDEDTLVRPTLFPEFLEKILGFSKNDFIPESPDQKSGKRPDFIPVDTNLHPFVFDAKGTDTQDLRTHYPQIKGYIESHNLDYGILCNMRDLAVFSSKSKEPIQEFSFSFYQLHLDYQKYKMTLDHILVKPNTRRFLHFVEKFYFQTVDKTTKIKLISEKKPWTGKEILEPDHLISKIRSVVSWLHDDVKSQEKDIPQLVESDERKRKIVQEIETTLEEIGKKSDLTGQPLHSVIVDKSNSYIQAKDIYFYRVAYFAMTRILLVRAWEDIGFIDETLYNGGFKKWYENFNREIRKILWHAFRLAADKYSWLYARENNYSWYEPSEDVLVDVLYEFSQFNFGKLNVDVLGTVYEEYVDRTDRKNKGQYYTPREIVSFIWDRVGFINDQAFFRLEGNKRQPRFIFDPATGSGGFLVEAARRIREEAKYDDKDFNEILEIQNAITNGLYGSEISAFPYYITEINILLQLTPVIKKLLASHKHLYKPLPYCLSVIRQDSLKLQMDQRVLPMTDILKDVRYEHDDKYDHIALEGAKREKFNFIRDGKDFDYVCANPPYIGEKGHKELFRQTIKYHPYWQKYYQGKMDYLYWFIILGLSKLKEGGKLGFITTSYWPTAEGASKLRKYILESAIIQGMIDFGETKIFEGAPGQHNMVFILEKCSDEKKRKNNEIKIVKVKEDFPGKTAKEKLQKLTEHISENIPKEKFNDKYIEMFVSPVKQGELNENAWNLKYTTTENKILTKMENFGMPISNLCELDCGIFSNADYLNKENLEIIPLQKREEFNIQVGDGIFVLNENEVAHLFRDDEKKRIIKRTYKNSDIDNYFIETTEEKKYLLYIDNEFEIEKFPRIKSHLEKFKEVLQSRLDRYGEKYPWWRLHRPHERSIYENPKIVTSRWGKENFYALQDGNFFENSDINLYIPKQGVRESIKYVLGLLNSFLLNFWIRYKGRGEGVSRQIRLKQIPIRRIDFKNSKEAKIHDKLVKKVDEIIEAKKDLGKFNKYFPKRLTRLLDNELLSEINIQKFIDELPEREKFSLRLHSEVKITPEQDLLKSFDEKNFYLARIKKEKNHLLLFGKDKSTLAISGATALLDILSQLLPSFIGKPFPEIKNNLLLPADISLFNRKLEKTLAEVKNLRNKIKNTQKATDDIVYDLYGINEKEKQIIEKHSTCRV